MAPRNQWGIAQPHGDFDEWEEKRLSQKGGTQPVMQDNEQSAETLLVDPRGNALIVRQPRPVGFRDPRHGR